MVTKATSDNPPVPNDSDVIEGGQQAGTGIGLVEITRIRPYDLDPRRSDNPQYERIKDSIRAEGLDQPLVITQRPGESDYMIRAGGNTRLRILQELNQETGKERFGKVECIYRPWPGETDVLLAHLRENDLRGELSFLEKSVAVCEVKRLLQLESEQEHVTQCELADTLRDRGYALSQSQISQIEYTVHRLQPLLPVALGNRLGRPQIERIRQLERTARRLWLDRSIDTEAEFDDVFAELCRRYDGPEWDIGNLKRALEAEMAERAEVSIHTVSMALEAYRTGHHEEAGAEWDNEAIRIEGEGGLQALGSGDTDESEPPGTNPSRTEAESSDRLAGSPDSQTASITNDEHEAHPADAMHTTPGDETVPVPCLPAGDLKTLRARAWTLASRLAQRNGLSELVQPLSGQGMGFTLRDVPDPALVDQLDEDTLAQVSMVWWYLAAAAEMTVARVEQVLPVLEEGSVLRRALDEQDAQLLFSSVWTLDPGHMGFRLWRRLDERDWQDLLGLMTNYRALYQNAENGSPWS